MQAAVGGGFGRSRNGRAFGAGLLIGSAAGVASTCVLYRLCYVNESKREAGEKNANPESAHPALQEGEPCIDPIRRRVFGRFIVQYSTALRTPLWVCEHLNSSSIKGLADRNHSRGFAEDVMIDELFRAPNDVYYKSGYDRGHLAPVMNYYSSQKDMDATFWLSNVLPQNRSMNREYWARLEKFAKELCKRHEDVWIISGPLFLPQRIADAQNTFSSSITPTTLPSDSSNSAPLSTSSHSNSNVGVGGPPRLEMRYPLLGSFPSTVAVPHGLFKVILTRDYNKALESYTYSFAAFALPNTSIPADIPIERFTVPMQQLEAASGLRFFPGVFGQYSHESQREALQASEAEAFKRITPALHSAKRVEEGSSRTMLPLDRSISRTEQLPASSSTRAPRQTKQLKHLCADKACELPPERFWQQNNHDASTNT